MPGDQSSFKNSTDSLGLAPIAPLDIEALGASFQHLAVDVVRGENTDFMSRWYRSNKAEADLVIWTDSHKRIIKHQLCFYGQVVEWNPISGTRTGLIVEEEIQQIHDALEGQASASAEPGDDQGVSETIRFDQSTQDSVVKQAIRLLSNVPDLTDNDKSALIFNLRESPRMHKKARERAMKVWAPKIDEIVSTQRPTFWKRLKKWVLGD